MAAGSCCSFKEHEVVILILMNIFSCFSDKHIFYYTLKWWIVLKSLPLHAMMLPCFLLMWGDSGGLGSNKSLLPWPKRNLMIQERNGREVEYPLLCTLDREPQMRFISIKPFTSLLKIIAQSQIWQAHLPRYIYHIFYLENDFLLLSARWIMLDILWTTAHGFNHNGNNNSMV